MERTGGETGDGGEPMTTMEAPPQQRSLISEEMKKKKNLFKVLVAVDESEGSFYALNWTLNNIFKRSSAAAATTTGAGKAAAEPDPELGMITVLHVMEPFEHYTFPAAVYATSAVVESVRRGQEQNAAEILARAFKICTQKGIKAETLIMEGDPKDTICHAVEEMHFDLLVVGSRGHGMIKRAFLGSVSDFCAHHATCPILIVKPPKERQHHK